MPTSSRFAIAVHMLTLMARTDEECIKSEDIARSVNTNAVVIRRLMCALSEAELLVSQTGPCGGSKLARAPQAITLLDIYRAVEGGSLFALHRQKPNRHCTVGRNIESVLEEVQAQMDEAVEGVLETITLEKVLQTVDPKASRRKRKTYA
ncbi:MAG: Rrf2 family transcriptional regulator [Acidobacteria bacterium]|nr:Rrf2 family transcriptional regulator [Acidobacteriota bacterium]